MTDTSLVGVKEERSLIIRTRRTNPSDTYTVWPDDCLSVIAESHYTTVDRLLELNPTIINRDYIQAGQRIKLPKESEEISRFLSRLEQTEYPRDYLANIPQQTFNLIVNNRQALLDVSDSRYFGEFIHKLKNQLSPVKYENILMTLARGRPSYINANLFIINSSFSLGAREKKILATVSANDIRAELKSGDANMYGLAKLLRYRTDLFGTVIPELNAKDFGTLLNNFLQYKNEIRALSAVNKYLLQKTIALCGTPLSVENATFINNLTRQAQPGEIMYTERFSAGELDALEANNAKPIDAVRPVALVLANRGDYNGAFEKSHSRETIQPLTKAFDDNLRYREVSRDSEILPLVKAIGRQRKIDLLVIAGHGESSSIRLADDGDADEYLLDPTDESIVKGLREYLAPDCKIILESCSTGAGGGNTENMANFIAKCLPGCTVFAPTIDSYVHKFIFDSQNKFENIIYNDDPQRTYHVIYKDGELIHNDPNTQQQYLIIEQS
ncbi:MAG: LysM peptidoglycan-binding domain-containing protein [Candidatus Margulisbacteria bacterium]|jgi:LysM repeat protein|nr:LysM peptidoglycan-binding domain-containing protein [Candidatus Margulisiibacteriota bacterium]